MATHKAASPGPGTGHLAERIAVYAFQKSFEASGMTDWKDRIKWAGGNTPNHDFTVILPFADGHDRALTVQVKSVSRKNLTLRPDPAEGKPATAVPPGNVEVIESKFRRPRDYEFDASTPSKRVFSDLWCFVTTSGSGKRTKAESTLQVRADGTIEISETTTIPPLTTGAKENVTLYWAPVCALDDLFHHTLTTRGKERAPKAGGNEVSAPLSDPRLHRVDIAQGEAISIADIETACAHLPHDWKAVEKGKCPPEST